MTDSPNALCFGDDLPPAGLPCRVEVSASGLTLQLPERPIAQVAFPALTFDSGGFERDQLVVRFQSDGALRTLFLKDRELLAAFWLNVPPALMPHLHRSAEEIRRARATRRVWMLAVLGTVAALFLVGWLGFDAVVRLAVARIPIEWERSVGEAALSQFLAGQTVVAEGPAVDAVRTITARLTSRLEGTRYRFEVTVVRSDVVNAFALPGGYVVVFTGLLRRAEGPDEVAGVLAHELNHVLLRHGVERMVRTLGLVAVVSILTGNQQGLVGLARRFGLELITLKFDRDQETAADVAGLRLLEHAQVSPAGLIRFFERLSDSDRLTVEMLSTHPMSAARVERLKAEAAQLPAVAPQPFPFDWNAVQASL